MKITIHISGTVIHGAATTAKATLINSILETYDADNEPVNLIGTSTLEILPVHLASLLRGASTVKNLRRWLSAPFIINTRCSQGANAGYYSRAIDQSFEVDVSIPLAFRIAYAKLKLGDRP